MSDDEKRLTVGDIREAIAGLPDDAQMFVGISAGPDLAITGCWASQQIPWDNDDWQKGDPLATGLELATEYFDPWHRTPHALRRYRLDKPPAYDPVWIETDGDALQKLDWDLNAKGQHPAACAFDRNARPILLWLDEEGGDSVVLRAARLGGEAAEVSEVEALPPDQVDWPVLAYFPRATS